MKVSIRKISEVTGYSPATVSNALNNKRGVNKKTSSTIFSVAKELGYRRNQSISKIRFVTYRKNGLIIDDTQIFPMMIEGVENKAKELGYETTFSNLNYKSNTFEHDLAKVLGDKHSVIILLGTEMTDEDFKLFEEDSDRVVILDSWSDDIKYSSVLIDNIDSAMKAVEHLINNGHTNIGYLKGIYRIKAFKSRELGYHLAMRNVGYDIKKENIVVLGTKVQTAYESMLRYLDTNPLLPTAFFADDDEIALGALKAFNERKIKIPRDVSIIGFDDVSFSKAAVPALTTMHVYKREMGEIAVRKVSDSLLGNKVIEKIQICADLIKRDSVREISRK
ncbi:MAG: LacI family DNA-binding transcriptional regulator [Suipraeoptans sp.]